MKRKILITGITGLIGSCTARLLLKKGHELHALVRPGTAESRLKEFSDNVNLIPVDLGNIEQLKKALEKDTFDCIVHIGALRGDRKSPRKMFLNVNIHATEQLILKSIKDNSELIYFSSVGVFGTSPQNLPAHNNTPQKAENYYYFTKKQCESLIQKYILQGLKACIIRPSVTYGPKGFGFPEKLINLIKRKLLFLPKEPVTIHLTNVDLLAQSVVKLLDLSFTTGSAYIIADTEPISLQELTDLISLKISGKTYARWHYLNDSFFKTAIEFLGSLKMNSLISSIEFLSKSWYYKIDDSYKELNLKPVYTDQEFLKLIKINKEK